MQLPSALQLPLVAVILSPLLFLALVFFYRRAYRSPIADIPGPLLAKFGCLWQIWVTIRGQVGPDIVKLHHEHGPFVRVAHNEVSIAHPDAIQQVLRSNMDKGPWYDIMAIPDSRFPNQMSERSAKVHIQKQKNLAAGYSLSNIIKSEPYIDNLLSLFRSRLSTLAANHAPVDWDYWLDYLTFDVVGEVTFSKQFGFLAQGQDIADAIKNQTILTIYLAVMAYFPWAHNYLLANPLIEKLGLQPAMHVLDTCNAAIVQRSSNDKVRKDMIEQWLEQHRNHPDRMPASEIFAAVCITVGAGADTVSAALQALLYYLLRTPDALALLRKELDTANLSDIPTFAETSNLPVLQSCIKETLRYHGPIAVSLPRVAPPDGITICNRFFPARTILSVHPYALQYLPEIYGPDFDTFRPQRWLEASESKLQSMEKCLIPYGAGYNGCPGQHLARLELCKTTALIVRDFEWEQVVPGKPFRCAYHFAAVPHDWPCFIKVRQAGRLSGVTGVEEGGVVGFKTIGKVANGNGITNGVAG